MNQTHFIVQNEMRPFYCYVRYQINLSYQIILNVQLQLKLDADLSKIRESYGFVQMNARQMYTCTQIDVECNGHWAVITLDLQFYANENLQPQLQLYTIKWICRKNFILNKFILIHIKCNSKLWVEFVRLVVSCLVLELKCTIGSEFGFNNVAVYVYVVNAVFSMSHIFNRPNPSRKHQIQPITLTNWPISSENSSKTSVRLRVTPIQWSH